MTDTVLACPSCDAAVNRDMNHRRWYDGGRRAPPNEQWICRDCKTTFRQPNERSRKRSVHV